MRKLTEPEFLRIDKVHCELLEFGPTEPELETTAEEELEGASEELDTWVPEFLATPFAANSGACPAFKASSAPAR